MRIRRTTVVWVALVACVALALLVFVGTARASEAGHGDSAELKPNEMGQVLVLMYHLIGSTSSVYNRTPERFRQDLADLKAAGYYPVNLHELVSGRIDVPAGKSPVVITFDDSSEGQYRILPDGTLDPDCAVGIMKAAAQAGGWAERASFFVLLQVYPTGHLLFGQAEYRESKLRNLVSWGYEVGSHTVTHLDLKRASHKAAAKELAESRSMLAQMIGGGYQVPSLAVPYGAFPSDVSLLQRWSFLGDPYAYTAVLKAGGGPSFSPFSDRFDPLCINRIAVAGNELQSAIASQQKHPELRYISDGDPGTIRAPLDLPPALGALEPQPGRAIVRY
jgi:peptidoglycan/xylan/chitin deacetylase (PgdA/CDA1 family)